MIKDILSGNSSAYAGVVTTYEKNIYTYLYRLCGSREDALDLTQDTFIKAYNSLGSFKLNMDFKPWLYRIAHNNFVNFIKSKKEFTSLDEELPDVLTPEDIVIGRDSLKSIDLFLKSLPHMYRAVFILRTIDDLSFKEIGSILKISEANGRMRYLRVRKMAEEMLKGGNSDGL
jgi:RNA polymerase sigma factor, sigma-70 family